MEAKPLKDHRQAAGLSQEALANKVGIAQPQISKYERGTKAPRLMVAKKIAEALGVSIEQIAFASPMEAA